LFAFFGEQFTFLQKSNKMAEKKDLFLRIKRCWLDKILSAEKTIEYRDFKDFYISRLCIIKDGEIVDVKKFDTITLVAGYRKDAPKATFESKGVFIAVDKEGNPIEFEIEIGKLISKSNID